MKLLRCIILILCCWSLYSGQTVVAQKKGLAQKGAKTANLTQFVNPLVGTAGHGHTYPGATMPFGLVQLSPDTRLEGWDGCSGYHYSDSIIYGFSHTHLSGVGVSDYGDILFTPMLGTPRWKNYAQGFSHKNESAKPGYYSVTLDSKIRAELTTTVRVGLHSYSFPAAEPRTILVDLLHRDKVLHSGLTITGDKSIEGFRYSDAWAKDQRVFFAAEFSEPFVRAALIINDSLKNGIRTAEGQNLKTVLEFKAGAKPIVVKVGISFVSIEGAKKNLREEAQSWNFEEYVKKANQTWNAELSAIIVQGGSLRQQQTFYTALYHTMIAPNIIQDVDGAYRGLDGKIHQSPKNHEQYSIFSLWDTFRAAHPLYTLIDERRTTHFINTFLNHYEQGGRLPVWELACNETDCMIGYHSVSVILDAYIKNIRGFDAEKALRAMVHSAELRHFGLEAYQQKGYIAVEDESESVSKTLEYGYDDWCIAVMAKSLGKDSLYKRFIQRAQAYKHLFDPSTGFMRARVNGGWFSPFDPREVNFHYTEGNSWHYSFFVPHDITGLWRYLGGLEKAEEKITALFQADSRTTGREQSDITGLIGQYAQGNEPSHHMAYLYNEVGKPWKTQELVRKILDSLYTPTPDGLPGNEDCGQMSAWYVLSAMGFYQLCPGLPYYSLAAPLFPQITLKGQKGKSFTITAPNVAPGVMYATGMTLNGKQYNRLTLDHNDILSGGVLTVTMASKPDTTWAKVLQRRTPAVLEEEIIPAPWITAPSRSFRETMAVEIGCLEKDVSLHYTLDGSTPGLHSPKATGSIFLNESATVKVIAVKPGKGGKLPTTSVVTEAKFSKNTKNWSITLKDQPVAQYSAGGAGALIDGLRGGNDFRTGEWMGFWGKDLEALIDLGTLTTISKVGLGCIQDIRPWIWMPTTIEFALSTNGTTFVPAGSINVSHKPDDYAVQRFTFMKDLSPQKARFVRVRAVQRGKIPVWHPGVGGDTYIFADEIIIE